MRVSENGLGLIKLFEGMKLEAYQDIAGIWTIGYGHTGPDVQPGMRISERDAEDILKRDLKPREDAVGRLVRVGLNQNEFDALVSFVFNVGETAFKNSTARARLNGGDRLGAAQALTWWNKATVNGVLREVLGLTRRRAAESALFLQPTEPPKVDNKNSIAENSRVTPIEDAPRRPNLAESRSVQGATVAGAAGVGASTLGRDSAQELNKLETDIASGEGATIGTATPADAGAPNTGTPDSGASGTGASSDAGSTDAGTTTGGVADGGATSGDLETTTGAGDAGAAATGETVATTESGPRPPSAREQYAAQSQIQMALTIMIVLAVLYIVFARLDDWWRYRR